MLEKEEFKNKINGIVEHIKNNDMTNATSDLLTCIDDYNSGFDELEIEKTKNTNLTDSNKELETKINSLKDVNMDLLLRVGTQQSVQNNAGANLNINNSNQGEDKKPLRFEDLFNEKGELK